MELNMMITRPLMLPTAAWPLTVSLPATAACVALLAAEQAPASRVHQAPIQAELGRKALVLVDGITGTNGFQGNNSISSKRYTDGGSGVPPRGRPV